MGIRKINDNFNIWPCINPMDLMLNGFIQVFTEEGAFVNLEDPGDRTLLPGLNPTLFNYLP
ncbi:hypothetical protein DOT_0182 [Desulfosporosinus sp. OT]|nr:hypothetical protein DOT_0182 [Desulfosporosinus sp. OT]